jgi:predicted nucleotidyltransferase
LLLCGSLSLCPNLGRISCPAYRAPAVLVVDLQRQRRPIPRAILGVVDIHEQLRQARKTARLSQTELSKRSKIPQPNISDYERGKRTPSAATARRLLQAARPSLSKVLAERRQDVVQVIHRHGGKNPRVFGSVARGEDGPDSDIDILVSLKPGVGLLARASLVYDLERIFGEGRVDVVLDSQLRPGSTAFMDARQI